MSTKPGVTMRPVGVDARAPPCRPARARPRRCGRRSTPTSARRAGAPVPSTTMPLRITRSATAHPQEHHDETSAVCPAARANHQPATRGRAATADAGARPHERPGGPLLRARDRTGAPLGPDVVATVHRRDHPRARRHPLGQVGHRRADRGEPVAARLLRGDRLGRRRRRPRRAHRRPSGAPSGRLGDGRGRCRPGAGAARQPRRDRPGRRPRLVGRRATTTSRSTPPHSSTRCRPDGVTPSS